GGDCVDRATLLIEAFVGNTARNLPSTRSHQISVLSLLPDRACRPSGDNATACTESLCPERESRGCPLSRFHQISVWSSLPDRACCPFGDNATALTRPLCPERESRGCPLSRFRTPDIGPVFLGFRRISGQDASEKNER